MSNDPIITPTPPPSGVPLGIGVAVAGSTAKYVLFVDTSLDLDADIGLQYDSSVKDLTVGRNIIATNIGLLGATSPTNPIEIGNAGVTNSIVIYMKTAVNKQKFIIFNENSADQWTVGMQLDNTFVITDQVHNKPVATFYLGGGVRLSVVTTSQKNALSVPAGTMVYDSDLAAPCWYDGANWKTITGS